jgi:catechol 2,3-dioxygenase-like lactoylglutathione lyase family enzyme
MHLMNIIYVSDMKKSVAFYESLGLTRDGAGPVDDWWNQFSLGGAVIALHWGGDRPIPQPSKHLEFHLQVSGDELDRLHALCEEKGYPVNGPISEMGFGRFFWTTDPDGLWVQFNEDQG